MLILIPQLVTTALTTPVTDLTISRSRWWNGRGSNNSRLELKPDRCNDHTDGYRCCLGFYALQCGYKQGQLIDKPYFGKNKIHIEADETNLPAFGDAAWLNQPYYESLQDISSSETAHYTVGGMLAHFNDAGAISQEERERKVAKIFLERGNVRVTFID